MLDRNIEILRNRLVDKIEFHVYDYEKNKNKPTHTVLTQYNNCNEQVNDPQIAPYIRQNSDFVIFVRDIDFKSLYPMGCKFGSDCHDWYGEVLLERRTYAKTTLDKVLDFLGISIYG